MSSISSFIVSVLVLGAALVLALFEWLVALLLLALLLELLLAVLLVLDAGGLGAATTGGFLFSASVLRVLSVF